MILKMQIFLSVFSLGMVFNGYLSYADHPKRNAILQASEKTVTKLPLSDQIGSNFLNYSFALSSGGNVSSSANYKQVNCIGQASPIASIESVHFINSSGFLPTLLLNNYHITGKAIYALNNKFVRQVSIFLSGAASALAKTNDFGYYEFVDLEEGKQYQTTAKKYHDFVEDSTINLIDAKRVHLYLCGSLNFNQNEWLASDVDENGVVDSLDKFLIIQRALLDTGVDTVKNHCGQWRFIPTNHNYPALLDDTNNQDFLGIILGDNNGSWQYASTKKPAIEPVCFSGLKDQVGYADSILIIPLSLDTKYLFLFAEIKLQYNPKILNFVNCHTTELTNTFNLVTTVDSTKGIIACALFAPDSMLLKGDLLCFQFKVVGKQGEVTELTISKFFINENIVLQTKLS